MTGLSEPFARARSQALNHPSVQGTEGKVCLKEGWRCVENMFEEMEARECSYATALVEAVSKRALDGSRRTARG